MPIVPGDLVAYNAVNRPEDDVATGGGARDVDVQPGFTQLAATDDLEVLSGSAADTTQTVTVDGRDAAGAFVTATGDLAGTSPIVLSPATQFERVLSILLDGTAVGIVTVRRESAAGDVYAIPIGQLGASAMFIKSASEVGAITRYDKMFWENEHATLTLNAAQVQITADPANRIRQGISVTKDDTATISDRTQTPAGITFVADSTQQSVDGTTLEALTAIGVWIEQALLAADSPILDTFTSELAGTTT